MRQGHYIHYSTLYGQTIFGHTIKFCLVVSTLEYHLRELLRTARQTKMEKYNSLDMIMVISNQLYRSNKIGCKNVKTCNFSFLSDKTDSFILQH